MATNTTLELSRYYASLLIYQYLGKAKAFATIQGITTPVIMPQTSIQVITFAVAPTDGSFQLSYGDETPITVQWDDLGSVIQSNLQSVPGLGAVTVSGEISNSILVVTFVGIAPPALSLTVGNNTLTDGALPVAIAITETDLTLPLAVQNGFNVLGDQLAQGVQLDVLGKYAGVVRTGVGQTGTITLSDSDFLILIQFANIINNLGSDLASITNAIYGFFGSNVLVFDFKNMHMSYLINSLFGSQDLIQLLIAQKLLPAPMTVQVSVVYAPNIDAFFGFSVYGTIAMNNSPFNDYNDYQTDWPWLDYGDTFSPSISMSTESGDAIVQEDGSRMFIG